MKKFNLYVGIDIGKNVLDVAIGKNENEIVFYKFSNDVKGIGSLLSLIAEYKVRENEVLICCEHTGVYLNKLAFAVQSTECVLWVIHPLLLKHYSTEINRYKTDKADAKKIMTYALLNQSKAQQFKLLEHDSQLLRDLFTARKQLLQTRTQYLNRKDASKQKVLVHGLTDLINETIIKFLNDLISELNKEIKRTIASNPKISKLYQILISIPGIGPVIAQHFLFVTDCFEKIKDWKAFACYIGTAPNANDSGIRKGRARVSKHSYKPLKADLNQGMVSLIRPGQFFHEYYKYLISINRHHLYILNKFKNLIIKTTFVLIKKQSEFDQEIFWKNKKNLFQCLQVS